MANEKENEQTATEMKELQGAVEQAQIDKWKALYGEIYAITGEGKICYVKKPDRKILAYASQYQNNPIKMAETYFNSCFLGGCEDFKTDDELFMSAAPRVVQIFKLKETELVKL